MKIIVLVHYQLFSQKIHRYVQKKRIPAFILSGYIFENILWLTTSRNLFNLPKVKTTPKMCGLDSDTTVRFRLLQLG